MYLRCPIANIADHRGVHPYQAAQEHDKIGNAATTRASRTSLATPGPNRDPIRPSILVDKVQDTGRMDALLSGYNRYEAEPLFHGDSEQGALTTTMSSEYDAGLMELDQNDSHLSKRPFGLWETPTYPSLNESVPDLQTAQESGTVVDPHQDSRIHINALSEYFPEFGVWWSSDNQAAESNPEKGPASTQRQSKIALEAIPPLHETSHRVESTLHKASNLPAKADAQHTASDTAETCADASPHNSVLISCRVDVGDSYEWYVRGQGERVWLKGDPSVAAASILQRGVQGYAFSDRKDLLGPAPAKLDAQYSSLNSQILRSGKGSEVTFGQAWEYGPGGWHEGLVARLADVSPRGADKTRLPNSDVESSFANVTTRPSGLAYAPGPPLIATSAASVVTSNEPHQRIFPESWQSEPRTSISGGKEIVVAQATTGSK